MARTTLLIGSVVAAALLAGCSGTPNDGNASAATTTSSSSAVAPDPTTSADTATSTATSTSTSTSTSSSTTSSADDSEAGPTDSDDTAEDTGSVQPASLDEQSKVWFGTFCSGLTGAFSGIGDAMGGADGTDPKATQAALVGGYQQVAAAFATTASDLAALPAPTVENGDRIASDLPAALDALSKGFATATDTFAAAEVTDEASLTAALDAFTAETDKYGEELQAQFSGLETTLTPEIGAAVEALPECQALSS